jgi:hypothetical protein
MRRIYKLVVLALVFAFATVSCEVERFPYNQIEQTQAFNTMNDANTIVNGMYMQLRNRMYGIYMYTTDVQADLYNATLEYGNRNGFPHTWEGFLAGDYNIRDIWYGYYSALTNVNNIIDNMGNVTTTNATEEATKNRYIGEAHLMRAFYYHQLVIRWGKPYNAATASSDLGVPLILTFDVSLRPARATVEQVYQQILLDIESAKALMPDGGSPNAERLTKDAALALEARVRLHMGDWPGVVAAAEPLINSQTYPLITNTAGLVQMWENDFGSELIFQIFADKPNELPSAINNIFMNYRPANGKYRPDFVPSQWVVDLFDDNDNRKNIFLAPLSLDIQGITYDDIYCLSKFSGNPSLWTTANSNYQHKPKVFRIAETYLNLAEAQYYIDESAARNTLNELRVARGLTSLGSEVTGEALMEEIRGERTRELLGEGFRLNDLMRWGMGVVRTAPQNNDLVVPGENTVNLNVPADHPKFIWGIPTNDLTTNPDLVQNPGW